MKLAGVVCTYGRAALAELLACIARQTIEIPTLVYVDNAPGLRVDVEQFAGMLHVVHGPKLPTIGAVRSAAVQAARERWPLDGFLLLDDDDFYASVHYEVTSAALRASAGWVAGLSIGITRDGGPPEYVSNEGREGQHATWGVSFEAYDRAGGYPDNAFEDVGLGCALRHSKHGRTQCTPHWVTTHVRREHFANLSGRAAHFDTSTVRTIDQLALGTVRPRWSAECEFLEQWCAARRAGEPLSTPPPPRRAQLVP